MSQLHLHQTMAALQADVQLSISINIKLKNRSMSSAKGKNVSEFQTFSEFQNWTNVVWAESSTHWECVLLCSLVNTIEGFYHSLFNNCTWKALNRHFLIVPALLSYLCLALADKTVVQSCHLEFSNKKYFPKWKIIDLRASFHIQKRRCSSKNECSSLLAVSFLVRACTKWNT